MRFEFCATGRSGLGHLRRVGNIAAALRERAPGAQLGLLTNAGPQGIEAAPVSAFDRIRHCPRREMAAQAAEADVIVVDTAVLPGLEVVASRLCLVLRETPTARLAQFALPERAWDCVVAPNPASHWLPGSHLLAADRYMACGWIRQVPAPRRVADRPTMLVATGGGGTPASRQAIRSMVEPLIESVRRLGPPTLVVHEALGPAADGPLDGVDQAVHPGDRLAACFAGADLVVSTAGYNSVLELAELDVPCVLVAIQRSFDDQTARAQRWATSLGRMLVPPYDAVAEWAAMMLRTGRRRPAVDLGPDGAEHAACALLDLAAG